MAQMTLPRWLVERPLGAGAQEGSPRWTEIAAADLLDMACPAEWLARSLLSSRDGPAAENGSLLVSIEAPWGAGKTSFLNLVKAALLADLQPEVAPVWVEFNAWQSASMATGVWASIAYRIGEALYQKLHRSALKLHRDGVGEMTLGSPGRLPRMVSLKTARLADERLHWLEVASIVAELIEGEDWHPCLSLFSDAPSKIHGPCGGWGAAALEGTRGLLALAEVLAPVLSAAQPAAGVLTAAAARALDAGEKTIAAKTKAQEPAPKGPERRSIGASWGVDTQEFVRLLSRLCAALVPHARKWRIAVVIDDVSRIGPEELRGLFDALSYLRELDDTVVLVTLDEPALTELEAQLPVHLRRQGERFVSKIIHMRYQLPPVHSGPIGRLGDRFLADLGLPAALPAGSDKHPVRRLILGGVRTPREMKRALAWMWMRLALDDKLLFRCQQGGMREESVAGVLALLVDIHLFTERLLSAEELDVRVRAARSVLLRFTHQPWDGQDWPDQGEARDFLPGEADLVAWLRCLRLAQFAGLKLDDARLEVAHSVWRRWCADLSAGEGTSWVFADAEGLAAIVTKERVSDVVSLFDPSRIQLIRLKFTIQISSAARFLWLTAGDETPTTFGEVLDRWHDADALAQAVLSERVRPKAAAVGAILLQVFHPAALKEIDPSEQILHCALAKAVPGDGASKIAGQAIQLAQVMQGKVQ